MSKALLVEALTSCTPDRFVRLGARLLERVAEDPRPRALVVRLTERALLLGRHQRARSAVEEEAWRSSGVPLLRRMGGGRAILAGEGQVGFLLALPSLDALLGGPIPADRFLNRVVRGLLVGLTRLGAGSGAHYFGRDYVSAESRQLARISQDGLPSGPSLFEAIIGIDEPLEPPPSLRGYPVHSDPRAEGPPSVTMGELWKEARSFEAIVRALAEGYENAYGVRAEILGDVEPREGGLEPPAWEEEEGFEESGVADIPIGFAEALLRRDGARIGEVRFRGDFIAPAFAIRGLERDLRGVALDFQAIGEKVDAAFRREGAGILGVRGLRIFPDAVLAAAGLH